MSEYSDFQKRSLLYRDPTTPQTILDSWGDSTQVLSLAEICGRVMRRVTPGMRILVQQMVDEGILQREVEPLKNGHVKYWYRKLK